MELSFNDIPQAISQLSEKLSKIEELLNSQLSEQHHQEPEDELLNVEQAANFLDLATASIYSKVSRGDLPALKRGKRIYFSKKDLWEFMRAGRKHSTAETESAADAYLKMKGGE